MKQRQLVVATFVVAFVAILASTYLLTRDSSPSAAAPAALAYYAELPTAGMTIGPADAPVFVEEYFDFQCPYCQTASKEVVKPLIEKYVKSGQVRFAYRPFPFLGPESDLAAAAAYCAAKQGQFWPYQELLFAREGRRNQGAYSEANLVADARRLNLNEAEFAQCLRGEEASIFVQGSYERARQMGLQGTPTYMVNGRVVNVGSFNDLERAIEVALQEAARE